MSALPRVVIAWVAPMRENVTLNDQFLSIVVPSCLESLQDSRPVEIDRCQATATPFFSTESRPRCIQDVYTGSIEAGVDTFIIGLLYDTYAEEWSKLDGKDPVYGLTVEDHIVDQHRNEIGAWAACDSGEEFRALAKR